jgi:hypothetical protein
MEFSPTVTAITKALVKVQEKIQNPTTTAKNPFFKSKYAPLDEILAMVRPILAENGLVVLQEASGDGSFATISTILMHDSGEYLKTAALTLKPVKTDPQGIGSAITYGRRYALLSILGLAGEPDDDANVATHGAATPEKAEPKSGFIRRPGPAQEATK